MYPESSAQQRTLFGKVAPPSLRGDRLLWLTPTRRGYRQSFPVQILLENNEERPSRPAGGSNLDYGRLTRPVYMSIG